jgi:hypothetical protein
LADGTTQWLELNGQGNITDPQPYPPSRIVSSMWKGRVFVNLYCRGELYVLTEAGVQVSDDEGSSFVPDTALTQLVTSAGTYPLTPGFSGGGGRGVRIANRSDRNQMGALADMAFLRDDPDPVAAVSPYTGLFYKSAGDWQDLRLVPRKADATDLFCGHRSQLDLLRHRRARAVSADRISKCRALASGQAPCSGQSALEERPGTLDRTHNRH